MNEGYDNMLEFLNIFDLNKIFKESLVIAKENIEKKQKNRS